MDDSGQSVIIAAVGDKGSSWDDFLAALPDSDCRYGGAPRWPGLGLGRAGRHAASRQVVRQAGKKDCRQAGMRASRFMGCSAVKGPMALCQRESSGGRLACHRCTLVPRARRGPHPPPASAATAPPRSVRLCLPERRRPKPAQDDFPQLVRPAAPLTSPLASLPRCARRPAPGDAHSQRSPAPVLRGTAPRTARCARSQGPRLGAGQVQDDVRLHQGLLQEPPGRAVARVPGIGPRGNFGAGGGRVVCGEEWVGLPQAAPSPCCS